MPGPCRPRGRGGLPLRLAGDPSLDSCTPGNISFGTGNGVIDTCEDTAAWARSDGAGCPAMCVPADVVSTLEAAAATRDIAGDTTDDWADADGDCDVDQDDFGEFQHCLTGENMSVLDAGDQGIVAIECLIYDRDCDGKVTSTDTASDLGAFQAVAMGPAVPYSESGPCAITPLEAPMGGEGATEPETLVDSGGPLEMMNMNTGPLASIDVAGNGGGSMTVTEDAPGAGWTGTFLLQTGITSDSDLTGFQYAINVNGGADNALFAYQFYLNRAHTAFGPTLFDAVTGPPTHWLNTDHWVACLNPLEDRPLSTVTIPEVVFNMNSSFDVAAAQFPGSLVEYRIATVGAAPVGTYVFSPGDVDPPRGFVVAGASAGNGQLAAGATFTLTVGAAQ